MDPAREARLHQILAEIIKQQADLVSFRTKQKLTIIDRVQRMMIRRKLRKTIRKLYVFVRANRGDLVRSEFRFN